MAAKNKQWTVMIYMSGDNDLSDECVWALKELYRVGVKGHIAVVAQYDPRAEGLPIYRFDIGKGLPANGGKKSNSNPRPNNTDGLLLLAAAPVGQPGREDMASPETLTDFIQWGMNEHPADHYMVILSGHGSAAEGNVLIRDENPPGFLTLPDLRGALEAVGHKIDIFGLDACAMSTAEVCFELSEAASYLVAAEGSERSTGWPYYRIIEYLNDGGNPSAPEALAEETVKRYVGYYSDYTAAGVSVDLAACKLSEAGGLVEAVMGLAERLTPYLAANNDVVKDALILSHWRAQSYRSEDYVDLWDFCDLLGRHCNAEGIGEACGKVMQAVDGCVVKSCYSGGAFQHSHGVSIYFPWTGKVSDGYEKLSFSISGNERYNPGAWMEFLKLYLTETRREARKGQGQPQPFTLVEDREMTIRDVPPWSKGADGRTARVKNPPDVFFRDEC